MNRFPLFSFPLLRIVFIPCCSLFINKLTFVLFHDEIYQILVGASSSPAAVLVQFTVRLFISVVGSKIENKFIIIFSFFY